MLEHLDDNRRQVLIKSHLSPWVLRQSEVTLDDVLKEPRRGLLKLTFNHIVENRTHSKKALSSLAEIL